MITIAGLERVLWEERQMTLDMFKKGILNKDLTIGKIGGLQRVAMSYHLDKFVESAATDFYQLRNDIITRSQSYG